MDRGALPVFVVRPHLSRSCSVPWSRSPGGNARKPFPRTAVIPTAHRSVTTHLRDRRSLAIEAVGLACPGLTFSGSGRGDASFPGGHFLSRRCRWLRLRFGRGNRYGPGNGQAKTQDDCAHVGSFLCLNSFAGFP